jgi:hypothetical protein
MADQPKAAPAKVAVSGQDVLLATKLHVPACSRVLCRARAWSRRSARGWCGSSSWFAPRPGSVKRRCWPIGPRRGRWPVAWLSLDAGDNDAARFWRHAAAALDRARPGIAERVGPLLGPPASGSFEELCDAVTGRTGSQALLEQVERAGLFLVSLDEVRGWWRYHHLFADLLRARLRQERPGQVVELHRNAAAWCEEHGLPDDAVCTRWPLGR